MTFYFETSFVNYIYDKYNLNDIKATKIHHSLKGNSLYISTVTLWEIMLTSNSVRRDGLIILCQNLFDPVLLKSPTEICFDYIIQKFPRYQRFNGGMTKMNIAETWRQLIENKQATIDYDFESFSAVAKQLKEISRNISKYIDAVILKSDNDKKESELNAFFGTVADLVFQNRETDNDDLKKIRKIKILLSYYILCAGIDIENTVCNKFWAGLGLGNNSLERLLHLVTFYPEFFHGGPIDFIANTLYFQKLYSRNKPNRGALHDALHITYLPFIDKFLTNDLAYKRLKEIADPKLYKKILHTEEITFTHKLIEIIPNGS